MNPRKRILSALMALLMTLCLLPVPIVQAASSASNTGSGITITESARWNTNISGQNTVEVSIKVESSPELTTPHDVIFLIDHSALQDLPAWKDAAKALCGALSAVRGMRMALIPFSTSANTALPFTSDASQIESAIDGLERGGNSNCYAALKQAQELVKTSDKAVIVLLSNGRFNMNLIKMNELAEELRKTVPIYGILANDTVQRTKLGAVCSELYDRMGAAVAIGDSRTYTNLTLASRLNTDLFRPADGGDGSFRVTIPSYRMATTLSYSFSGRLKDLTQTGELPAADGASLTGDGLSLTTGPVSLSRGGCTVTYDPNGGAGSVPVDNNCYPAGTEAAVKPKPADLKKEGQNFSGWVSDGAVIRDGKFTVNSDTTLKAAWGRAYVKLSSSTHYIEPSETQMMSWEQINAKFPSDGAFYKNKGLITTVRFCNTAEMALPSDAWDISDTSNGKTRAGAVKAWLIPDEDDEKLKGYYKLFIGASGRVSAPINCTRLFRDFVSLKSVQGMENLDTSHVTTTESMFYQCYPLSTLDVSGWDTSSLTSTKGMFNSCTGLTSVVGIDRWKTSGITDTRSMFNGCSSLTSLDLSRWDVSRVLYMQSMFSGCAALTSVGDLSGWSFPAEYCYLSDLFNGCAALGSVPGIENWNTSSVKDMNNLFTDCASLSGSLDLSGWDISQIISVNGGYEGIDSMFSGCASLTSVNLSGWNTSNIEDLGGLFGGCTSLETVDLSNWNIENVTSMAYMFQNCTSLTSWNFSGWGTPTNGVTASHMFENCESLTDEDLSLLDGFTFTQPIYMFAGCTALTSPDLSNWRLSNKIDYMFYGCTGLTEVTLPLKAITYLNTASYLFSGCTSLTTVDLSELAPTRPSNFTDISGMFSGCTNLTQVTLPVQSLSAVTTVKDLFSGCTSLSSVGDLSGWDMSKVENMEGMFHDCAKLTTIGTTELVVADGCDYYTLNGGAKEYWNSGSGLQDITIKTVNGNTIYPEPPTDTAALSEEAPAEETPVEEASAEEALVEETPVEEAPAQEAPVEEVPVEEVPAEETPAEEAPAEEVPAGETPEILTEALLLDAARAGELDRDDRPIYANEKAGIWDRGLVEPQQTIDYALELQYLPENNVSSNGVSGDLVVTNRIPAGLTYRGDASISPAPQRIAAGDNGPVGGSIIAGPSVSGNVLTFSVTGLSAGAKYVVRYTCTVNAPAPASGEYTEFLNTASVNDSGLLDHADPVRHYMGTQPSLLEATFAYEDGSPAGAPQCSSIECESGEGVTLPAPTLPGYTFNGWKANGATYAAGSSYTMTANTDFVGSWTPVPVPPAPKLVHVEYTFDSHAPEDGALILANLLDGVETAFPEGASTSAPVLADVPEGYAFAWEYPTGLEVNGNGVFHVGLASDWPPNATIPIQGDWTRLPYTVTYRYDNGPGTLTPPGPTSHTYGETVTLAEASASRAGKAFLGWLCYAKDEDGDYTVPVEVDSVDGKDRFTMPCRDVLVTGYWTEQNVLIDPNGGTWRGKSGETVLSAAEYQALEASGIPDPVWQGGNFIDWKVETALQNDLFSKVLTAQWELKKQAVLDWSIPDQVYDGAPIQYAPPTITGATVDPVDLSYSFQGVDGTTYGPASQPPTNVGSYRASVTLPAGVEVSGDMTADFRITPAEVSITADSFTIKKGTALPALTYRVSGLVGTDTLLREPTLSCAGDGHTAGTYPITAAGAAVGDHYTLRYVPGTLTVTEGQTYTVSGTLTDENDVPLVGARVVICQGVRVYKDTITGQDGNYTFDGIEPGIYNVVAYQNDVTKTILAVVSSADLEQQNIKMPPENTNSELVVDNSNKGTPAEAVVVGGLEAEAEIVRKQEEAQLGTVSSVRVKMTVQSREEKEFPQEEVQAIRKEAAKAAPAAKIDFLDFSVTRTLNTADAEPMRETSTVLEIVIHYDIQGKKNVKVLRYHQEADGADVITFTPLPQLPENEAARQDGTCYLDEANGLIHVFAQKFSTYAISYEETPAAPPAPRPNPSPAPTPAPAPAPDSDSDSDSDSGNIIQSSAGESVSGLLDTTDHRAFLHGFTDGSFRPEGAMTRAQTAQMFYNLLLEQDAPAPARFSDVPAGIWCEKAINTLAAKGIMKGLEGGLFLPDRPITRAEFVVTAVRFAAPDVREECSFSDISRNDWFYPQLAAAVQYGWISGYSDGTFRPYAPIARSEAAAIVNRMLSRTADRDYVDGASLGGFPDVPRTHWAYYEIMEATISHDYRREKDQEVWTSVR